VKNRPTLWIIGHPEKWVILYIGDCVNNHLAAGAATWLKRQLDKKSENLVS
jgi:hypothetical protein